GYRAGLLLVSVKICGRARLSERVRLFCFSFSKRCFQKAVLAESSDFAGKLFLPSPVIFGEQIFRHFMNTEIENFQLIESSEQLKKFVSENKSVDWMSFDTEFVGER